MITRAYALPMSIFSWLVAFAYGLSQSGNIIYGIIALFGICFAHLGANMFDDYIDYNTLKRVDENGNIFLLNAQQGKCEYLLNKTITPNQLLLFSLLCFGLAVCIGIFFISKIGITAGYSNGYAAMIEDNEWSKIHKKYNVMLERKLRMNFRLGYWEIAFYHTKPLSCVPKDMRMC